MSRRPIRKDSLLKREQLEKLPTKRLLAYKNSLLRAVEFPSNDGSVTASPIDPISKQSPEWIETMHSIRDILSDREHVDR